jgi:SPP1 gp7 family putative phage head morphogenesis protein
MNRKQHTVEQIRALRAIAQTHGKKTRARKRLPRQLQPDMIRVEYLKAIHTEVLFPMMGLVIRDLIPELGDLVRRAQVERGDSFEKLLGHLDASTKDAQGIIAKIAAQLQEDASPAQLERLAQKIGQRTSEFQKEQLRKQIKAAVAVDPMMREAGIAGRVGQFTQQNVALIKTVPQRFFSEIEQAVISGVRSGRRASDIADDIEERYGVAVSNAQRIANDQVGKFFGELNQTRQTQLGIDSYIWRGMLDNRERPEHELREGNSYDWSDPPDGGHPGEDINCRCWAEPDLSDILGAL